MNQEERKNIISEVERFFKQILKNTGIPVVRTVLALGGVPSKNDERYIKTLLYCLISKNGRIFDLKDYFFSDGVDDYLRLLSEKGYINLRKETHSYYFSNITILDLNNKIEDAIKKEDIFQDEISRKYEALFSTSDCDIIFQFTKKFGKEAQEIELEKLRKILEKRKWEFSLRELKIVISIEFTKQKDQKIKSRILLNNPKTKDEILYSYLNFYKKDDEEMLNILLGILEDKGFTISGISSIKSELNEIQDKIELEHFEQQLLKTEEQLEEQLKIEDIDLLDGYKFENLLQKLYEKMGYQVEQTKLSGDQGADLIVVKFGEKTIIQAKRFGGKVGNRAVQEIMAAISLYKAQKGMVITNNYFTPAAVELADANNIELIDRDALEELINKYW